MFRDQNPILIYNYSLGGLITNDKDHFILGLSTSIKVDWTKSYIVLPLSSRSIRLIKKLNSRSYPHQKKRRSWIQGPKNHMHNVRLNPKKSDTAKLELTTQFRPSASQNSILRLETTKLDPLMDVLVKYFCLFIYFNYTLFTQSLHHISN